MLNQKDILQTQDMIDKRHLDIRTITMGISLLDCCDPDLDICCEKIYRKITTCARDLVKVGAGCGFLSGGFLCKDCADAGCCCQNLRR